MKPRTPPRPERTGVSEKAKEELSKYGRLQQYKLAIAGAVVFWQEQARPNGLPSKWDHRHIVSVQHGDVRMDWRMYVETVHGIRMGFAESLDGLSLRLLLLVPTERMSAREALQVTQERT
jgi:hypothetical protein